MQIVDKKIKVFLYLALYSQKYFMKRFLIIAFVAMMTYSSEAQELYHQFGVRNTNSEVAEDKKNLVDPKLVNFSLQSLTQKLLSAPQRRSVSSSQVVVSFPNADGSSSRYKVSENSNFAPELAARYPEIRSFIGHGIDDPTATIYFSISPLGLQAMTLKADSPTEFIEPYTTDRSLYAVYRRSDQPTEANTFSCHTPDEVSTAILPMLRPNADDAYLRTFRLALSVTGEYTAYFGGTKALALAGINNTLTRVNGVFEKDFAARVVLIANTDAVIYTNASTDPYSPGSTGSDGAWNTEVQSTLTSVIGEANYDVGHLFGASGGGGNAGCIGCVCINNQKGRGFTSPSGAPAGDNFDIDYVAHELGHQFGATHTFSHSNESTGVQMEPGSGSTIMGYAGITSKDVQPHSDAYFHAVSIQQVTNNIKLKTCPVKTPTGNTIPTVDAGSDYTIPKSTAFKLTGSGSDANTDVLTYNWEQMNSGSSTATVPTSTNTSGPLFRSYAATTSASRYFPKLSSLLTGGTTTAGSEIVVEALPSVARQLNFRLTVRDNRAGGGGNNSDDMVVTVSPGAGPFMVNSPNTAVSYSGGSNQTITWAVAGTTTNDVNCANVDILLSTDGGQTFPTTLLASTPNDGSQSVVIPNIPGVLNRIMVKGTNHIFFDVSNANFTITSGVVDAIVPTPPTVLAVTLTTQTSSNLAWVPSTDNVGVAAYNVYQNGVLKSTSPTPLTSVAGLTPATSYSFYVRAKDAAGNLSPQSNTVSVTTLPAGADTTAPSTPTSLAASGTTSNKTNLTWTASTDNIAVATYSVYKNGSYVAAATGTSYTVTGLNPSTNYSFTVKGKDAAGNLSPASNVVSVTTTALGADTVAPSKPTNLTASGTTQTKTVLSWTGSTDNVGVASYSVYKNSVYVASATGTTYTVNGLTASTAYSFTVKAKDAAGNLSAVSNTVSVTTLPQAATYCTSMGNSVAYEKISKVQFGTINMVSTGGSGYTSFTTASTNVSRGSSYTIAVTPQWTGTVYGEGYAAWIDFNKDGDFSDAGELVWSKSASTVSVATGTITIPASASTGSTRMRVSMKNNGIPTPCEIFARGQVEDYTVNIVSTGRDSGEDAAISFKLYPNPVQGDELHVSGIESDVEYRIYNLTGRSVAEGKTSDGKISVSTLVAGIYLLQIVQDEQWVTKKFVRQ